MSRAAPQRRETSTELVTAAPHRHDFTAALARLKTTSSYSYQALAGEIGRPVSTVHGWCTGKHLPYPRDNDVFRQLLGLLGVDDTRNWMETLAELRHGGNGKPAGSAPNPYRGLEPFTEDDADNFFGRFELTDRIIERIDHRLEAPLLELGLTPRLIAVVGASGSGKTSLLRAGVMPRLARRDDVEVTYLTPDQDDPLAHLTRVADDIDCAATQRPATRHVVIIDRLEVLLGEAHQPSLDTTMEVIDGLRRTPNTAVVVGLRADFFHRATTVRIMLDALQHDPVVVGPMTFEEATDCIVRPAERAGLTVAPDLVVELIAEFARHVEGRNATEALPLLSHVLYLLADETDDRHLTVAHYREIGGLEHALERSADNAYDSLTATEQLACHALFRHLVELDPKALPTRRTLSRVDLARSDPHLDFDVVIDRFAEQRLLTADVDSVTISHEALLTAWPLLTQWIENEHDALAVVRRIRNATRNWLETGEDPHALAGGTLLATAERRLTTSATSRLSADERRFVRLSTAAQELIEQRDAEVLSRQLAMQAAVLRPADPALSAQIALIAHETAPTVWTRSAVLSATSPLPGARYLGSPGPTVVASSADGNLLAVTDAADGSVRLYRRRGLHWGRDRALTGCVPGSTAYAIALSPDGTLLAVGGTDCVVSLVDLTADDERIELRHPGHIFDGPVHSLTFDHDGARLTATGTGSGVARWTVAPGPLAAVDQLIERPGTTMGVAVDRNGNCALSHMDGSVQLYRTDHCGHLRLAWADDGHPDVPASAVDISPDGSVLVAGYRNGDVRAWTVSLHSGAAPDAELTEIELGRSAEFASWVNDVVFSPSGHLMAAAASDGRVRIWDTRTWTVTERELQHPTVVTAARWASDAEIVTTAEDGTLRSWHASNLATGERGATIWSVSYDRSGERLLSCSPNFALVHATDDHRSELSTRSPRLMWRLVAPEELTLSGASAVSPNGRLAVLGTRQGTVLACPLPADGVEPVFDVNRLPADVLDRQRAQHLDPLAGLVENVCFSADGRILAASDSAGHVRVWQVTGSDDDVRFAAHPDQHVPPPALNLATTHDGRHLAVASEAGTVHLFEIPDNPDTPLAPVSVTKSGQSFATSVAFHPTLPVMAVANADRSVSVWSITDLERPTLVQRIHGPGGHPFWLCFSPGGDRLAAGFTDGWVWLWDVTGLDDPDTRGAEPIVEYARIESEGPGVYTITICPCGTHLIGAGPRGRIDRWIIDEQLAFLTLEAACGDEVTPTEWSSYVPTVPFRHATRHD